MRHYKKKSPPLCPGKLTVLALSLSVALASMVSASASAQVISSDQHVTQTWTSGDFLVNSGVLIDVSNGVAISATGSLGNLTNGGTIRSTGTSFNAFVNNGTIATLNNTAAGTIYGGHYGMSNVGGTISALTNSGMIGGDYFGVSNTGTIGILNNSGTISGGRTNGVSNAGTIATLINSGVIASGLVGIFNSQSITSLNNSGAISGNGTGIVNYSSIGTLVNSGTISGGSGVYGICNASMIATLSNTGLIAGGTYGIGNLGNIGTLSNNGTLTGRSYGLHNAGTISTLSNSGTISGSVAALNLASHSALTSFFNTGVIAGDIINDSGTALTIDGGSGTRFGTLTGASGSISASAIGSIASGTDLIFNNGNQLLNDNINVNSGNGTVTNAAGVLQVNNPITIAGSYYQDAAAALVIGISSGAGSRGTITDTGYGRLIVTGDATVEAGSTITLKKLTSYNYAVGQRFVVIQASGTADYNAASLSYSGTGYTANGLEVDDGGYHNLVVTITGVRNGSVATTSNANAVLHGLFNYTGVNQSLLDVFNPAMALADSTEATRAGAQLSPAAARNGVANASMKAFDAVQSAAGNRLDTVRPAQAGGSGVATGEGSLDSTAWGRIFGGQAKQGERDGISGYHANFGGFMVGGDAQVGPDSRVGGLFSYAHTNIGLDGDNNGSSGSVNAYGLTAYAGFDGHPWYLNVTGGVARQLNSTTRLISYTGFSGIANGSFKGTLYVTTAEAGYPLAIGDATLTPLAGLRYSSLKQDGYTETGGSGAALTVNGSSYSSLKSELGANYERSLKTSYGELKPFARLSWNHEYRNTAMTTSASFAADTSSSTAFTTQGASPLRNTAALSLGATLVRGKNLILTARYTLEGASGFTAQTGDLSLSWQY